MIGPILKASSPHQQQRPKSECTVPPPLLSHLNQCQYISANLNMAIMHYCSLMTHMLPHVIPKEHTSTTDTFQYYLN